MKILIPLLLISIASCVVCGFMLYSSELSDKEFWLTFLAVCFIILSCLVAVIDKIKPCDNQDILDQEFGSDISADV